MSLQAQQKSFFLKSETCVCVRKKAAASQGPLGSSNPSGDMSEHLGTHEKQEGSPALAPSPLCTL